MERLTQAQIDEMIAARSDCDLLRKIQHTAYRSTSKLHKLGVDAVCGVFAGPIGLLGAAFSTFDKHREEDADQCISAVNHWLKTLDFNPDNAMLVAHFIHTHPGRIDAVKTALQEWGKKKLDNQWIVMYYLDDDIENHIGAKSEDYIKLIKQPASELKNIMKMYVDNCGWDNANRVLVGFKQDEETPPYQWVSFVNTWDDAFDESLRPDVPLLGGECA